METNVLKASKVFDVRFSEVDSMNVVWHGAYPLYFEDAREEFGRKYKLEYLRIAEFGYYAPLVDLEFHYRRPLTYKMRPRIDITFHPTEAAKIVFDYEIHEGADDEIAATGRSVQVFMDKDYRLVWTTPQFFLEWKRMWHLI
ncbi:MAG: acyl-CoA thioesterase [Bacteroidaceae bacterium]|nr:acyl-CoA thioesterase [Bacteroidaceae bacterium]